MSKAEDAIQVLETEGEVELGRFIQENQHATRNPAGAKEGYVILEDGSSFITAGGRHRFAWTQGEGTNRDEYWETRAAETDVSGGLIRRVEEQSATVMMTIHGLAQDILKEWQGQVGQDMEEEYQSYQYDRDLAPTSVLEENEALNRVPGLRETIVQAMDEFVPPEVTMQEVEHAHDGLVLMINEKLTQEQEDEIQRITKERLLELDRLDRVNQEGQEN